MWMSKGTKQFLSCLDSVSFCHVLVMLTTSYKRRSSVHPAAIYQDLGDLGRENSLVLLYLSLPVYNDLFGVIYKYI